MLRQIHGGLSSPDSPCPSGLSHMTLSWVGTPMLAPSRRHCHTQLTAMAEISEMDLDMKVWKRVFQELIQEVKPYHTWQLTLDKGLLPNILKPGWAQYQQQTFAR